MTEAKNDRNKLDQLHVIIYGKISCKCCIDAQKSNLYTTKLGPRSVQYRKWSLTATDPETVNDPQNGRQMILDRKWSPKSTANDPERKIGMTWTQELADHRVDFIVITKRQIKS